LPPRRFSVIPGKGTDDIIATLLKNGWVDAGEGEWDFKYVAAPSAVEHSALLPHQIANHFEGAGPSLTTKHGLLRSLRRAPWVLPIDAAQWFPRCYDLSDPEDAATWQIDFRWGACEVVVQGFLNNPPQNEEEVEEENDAAPPQNVMESSHRLNTIKNALAVVEGKVAWLRHLQEDDGETEVSEMPLGMDEQCWEEILRAATPGAIPAASPGPSPAARPKGSLASAPTPQRPDQAVLLERARKVMGALRGVRATLRAQAKMDGPQNIWILKPAGKSRGRGILCFDNLPALERHLGGRLPSSRPSHLSAEERIHARLKGAMESHVVQRYLEYPLLLHNRKFDIRTWVAVTSWAPLQVWIYSDCYIRFCAEEYEVTGENLSNSFRHLCNNAVSALCHEDDMS